MHTAAQYEESGGSVTVSVGEGGATARPDAVAGAPLGRRAGRRLPRNSRSTTSRFRLALHRCPGAKAPAPTAAGTSARPNAVARVSQQGGWVPGAPTPDHETRLARRSPADRLPSRWTPDRSLVRTQRPPIKTGVCPNIRLAMSRIVSYAKTFERRTTLARPLADADTLRQKIEDFGHVVNADRPVFAACSYQEAFSRGCRLARATPYGDRATEWW